MNDPFTALVAHAYQQGLKDGMVIGAALIAWAEAIRTTAKRRRNRELLERYAMAECCLCFNPYCDGYCL